MAKLTITNLTAEPVLLQELYTTLAPGATLETERFKDDLHSHPRIQALWDDGTISVSVVPESSEDTFIDTHLHSVAAPGLASTPPEEIADSTGAVGTDGVAARGDHVHAHGDRAGGTLHALATDTVAGFMSPGHFDTVEDLPTNVADEDATSTYHEPTILPESGTNSPGQQPDLELIGSTVVAQFTLDTDTSYRLFKIPSNYVSGAEFHVHWTKEEGVQGNGDESGNEVLWRISYTVMQGGGTDINVAPSTIDLPDTYTDSGTTTRVTHRTANVAAPGFVAGYYVGICIEAVTPAGTALTCEPALISADLTYTQNINK